MLIGASTMQSFKCANAQKSWGWTALTGLTIAGLVEAVEIAASLNLTLTVEHFGDKRAPFRVSEDVNEAVRAVPGLKITYDSGNVWFGGENAADGFFRSRKNIVHVHFKDWELAFDDVNGLTAADGENT